MAKDKLKKNDTFLGIVERDGIIFMPWRGTHVSLEHNFEPGQDLLVTLQMNRGGSGKVIKAELPTLEQLRQMKDELSSDWHRLAEVFRTASMGQRVLMLRALDHAMRARSWER